MDKGAELAAEVGSVAHGTVPVADNGLGDECGEVVVVLPADTLDGNGNVGRGDRVVTDPDLGADKVGLGLLGGGNGLGARAVGLNGHVAKVLLGELDELVVGDAAGTDENHTVGSVVGLDVVGQVVAGDGLDVLLGSEDGAAEGLVHKGSRVQVVKDNLLELFVDLLLLAEDDVALALNGRGLELGVLEDVGEDVDRVGHIRVE